MSAATLVSLPLAICQLAKICYDKSLEVQRFRHDCRKLMVFVQRIECFVTEVEEEADIKQSGWDRAFMALHESMEECCALITECSKYGRIRSLINSDDMVHRFNSVTQRLNMALGMMPIQMLRSHDIHLETLKGLQQDMLRAQYTAIMAAERQSADLKKLMDMARADSSKTHDMLSKLLDVVAGGKQLEPEEITAEVADLREELLRARALKNKVEEDYLRQIIQAIEGDGDADSPSPAALLRTDAGLPPSDLLCPITYRVFQDPVIMVESGHTYERSSIEEWLVRGRRTDPLTGTALETCMLVPNVVVTKLVADWLAKNPGYPTAADSSTSFRPAPLRMRAASAGSSSSKAATEAATQRAPPVLFLAEHAAVSPEEKLSLEDLGTSSTHQTPLHPAQLQGTRAATAAPDYVASPTAAWANQPGAASSAAAAAAGLHKALQPGYAYSDCASVISEPVEPSAPPEPRNTMGMDNESMYDAGRRRTASVRSYQSTSSARPPLAGSHLAAVATYPAAGWTTLDDMSRAIPLADQLGPAGEQRGGAAEVDAQASGRGMSGRGTACITAADKPADSHSNRGARDDRHETASVCSLHSAYSQRRSEEQLGRGSASQMAHPSHSAAVRCTSQVQLHEQDSAGGRGSLEHAVVTDIDIQAHIDQLSATQSQPPPMPNSSLPRLSQLSSGSILQAQYNAASAARDDTASIAGSSEGGKSGSSSSRAKKGGMRGLLASTKYMFAFDRKHM